MKTKISTRVAEVNKAVTALSLFLTLAMAVILIPGTAKASKAVDYEVYVGKSAVITLPAAIGRVSITDPNIADVVVISPTEVQINGKTLGSTSLIIWDKAGKKTFFDINVSVDITSLKDKIAELAPGDDINMQMLNNQTLVVTGNVSSDERKLKIKSLLLGFGKDITENDLYVLQGGVVKEVRSGGGDEKGFKFVLLLEVTAPREVLLQITVASVDRTATKALGINWVYAGDKAIGLFSGIGAAPNATSTLTGLMGGLAGTASSTLTTPGSPTGAGPTFGVIDFQNNTAYFLRVLSSKGLATLLAEPNLIVKSGETGEFTAGGEVPIPLISSLGTTGGSSITVQYKKFGVILNFSPLVTESGLIKLKLDPVEFSSVSGTVTVTVAGISLPTFNTNRVRTSVDLREGESFVIAGLISNEWSKNLDKVPLLGDIPILGAFFRDQRMQKTERELVFVVTPKLMTPMAPGKKVELPGMAEPNAGQQEDLRWIPMLPNSRSLDGEQLK